MVHKPLVLAVDDEASILRVIRLGLSTEGFDVICVTSGEDALAVASEQEVDLALLDIVMPGMSGFDVLVAMKERWNFPVILLTARGGGDDRLRGLQLGADDYVPKPFSPEDLTDRVRNTLRHHLGVMRDDNLVRVGRVEIDLNRRIVRRNDEPVHLTTTEWKLLEQMAINAGNVIPNEKLLASVWGAEYARDHEYLRVWVSRLRRKLGDNSHAPNLIKASDGSGYLLRGA